MLAAINLERFDDKTTITGVSSVGWRIQTIVEIRTYNKIPPNFANSTMYVSLDIFLNITKIEIV
jgi:hypothetical protein